jgi:glycosyltransferase involved in cell wall biosynthesis
MLRGTVLVVDPGNYTPYYDVNLCHSLLAQGWHVEWWTSPYHFEPIAVPSKVPVRYPFFRGPSRLMRRLPVIGRVPIVRRSLKALSYPFDLLWLDRELSARAPGVLHVQWALLPILDACFWKRWQSKGWKIVYTAHDARSSDDTIPGLQRAGSRRLFRLADVVAAHSESERAHVVRAGGPAARVTRVPQGVPGVFQSGLVEQAAARRALGHDASRPTILFFGLLKAYKGLPTLLESLAAIRESIPDVLLMIVGASLVSHRACRRAIDRLGLAEHVHWERRYVPSSRVHLYFAAADVVALPYRAVSSSAVLLTAYAHARPVVATKVGGLPEMIDHGGTGLVVPADSPAAFADALVELLSNLERTKRMGERAREYALAHHEWPLIGRQISDIYRALDE